MLPCSRRKQQEARAGWRVLGSLRRNRTKIRAEGGSGPPRIWPGRPGAEPCSGRHSHLGSVWAFFLASRVSGAKTPRWRARRGGQVWEWQVGRRPQSQQVLVVQAGAQQREELGTSREQWTLGDLDGGTHVVHQSARPSSRSSLMCRGHVQGPRPQPAGRASSWTLGSLLAHASALLCRGKHASGRTSQALWCYDLRNFADPSSGPA